MAISRQKVKVSLYLPWEIADFMRKSRGRPTDPARGRFNWSEVADELLRAFIAQQRPDVVARIREEQREDLLAAVRMLERRVQRDLGTSLEALLTVNGNGGRTRRRG